MKKTIILSILILQPIIIQYLYSQPLIDKKQQFINIGNFSLENGQQIIDCKIGYRTFGKLNDSRSNVVVFLTGWGDYTGRFQFVVPGKYVDTTKFYLILVDALGNGVSSSPSNSIKQPKTKFPQFNIRDLVKAQYKMLKEKMQINHLIAIGGFSMGGIQAFQWAVSYPDYMDKIISIEGSPNTAPYDLLWTNIYLEAVKNDPAYRGGNYDTNPVLVNASRVAQLVMTSPEHLYNTVKIDSFYTWLSTIEKQNVIDCNDLVWQLKACMSHNIGANFGGSIEEAAKKIKAKCLIITNKQDHSVNPEPSIKIASMINAKLIVMDSALGHFVLFDKIPIEATQDFLLK